jgi:two-component system nitrate/nitrite response regulator NarL
LRILLADDHDLVREALAQFLTRVARDISCVEAADLDQACEKLASMPDIDMAVLDLHMPGMNGLAGIDVVRQRRPDIPIVIISGQIAGAQAREALARGARGVIPKDLRGTALLSALRLIAAGESYLPPALAVSVDSGERRVDRELRTALGQLTMRELDCVRHLVRGDGNKAIAEALSLSEVTVKGHLNHAYRKMGARNRADAMRIAMLHGIESL